MTDWMWGFAFGVISILMLEGISWVVVMFWLLRGIEAPPKPLWTPKTQKMIDETAAMGEEMVKSVEKMEGKATSHGDNPLGPCDDDRFLSNMNDI